MLTTPMAGSCDSSTKTQTECLCSAVRLCSVPRPDTRTRRFFSQILGSNRYSICTFPYLLPPIDAIASAVVWIWFNRWLRGGYIYMAITFSRLGIPKPGMVANSARGQLNRENRLRNRESQHTSHLRLCRCECS